MTGRLQFVFISQLPTCACRTGWLAVLWGPTSQVRVCVVLVSLGMLDRDDCTSCAALLEGPILSTGKIQAHHLQYHPTLAKTEGTIVGVRPAFVIHHRYAARAHRSLVKGRSQACVLIGSTMLLVTVTVCNRSTGWFGELRPRMFGQHSQVRTATSGEGQRLPHSLVVRTKTSGVGQRLQYSWVPRRCKRRLREESELQSGRLQCLFCVDPPCAVRERTTVETDLRLFQ